MVAQRLGAFSSRRFDGSQCLHLHCCPHLPSDTAADPRRLQSSLFAYSELFLHEDTEVSVENRQAAKDKLTVVLSVNTYPALSWTVIFSTVLTGAATDFCPIPDESVRILATYSLRFMFTLFRHLCLGLSCFITSLPLPSHILYALYIPSKRRKFFRISPEYRGSKFLRNVGTYLPNYTASHPSVLRASCEPHFFFILMLGKGNFTDAERSAVPVISCFVYSISHVLFPAISTVRSASHISKAWPHFSAERGPCFQWYNNGGFSRCQTVGSWSRQFLCIQRRVSKCAELPRSPVTCLATAVRLLLGSSNLSFCQNSRPAREAPSLLFKRKDLHFHQR